MTRKPETALSRSIQLAIEATGATVLRLQSSGKRGIRVKGGRMQLCPTGTPDLLCILRGGRCVFLEIKREGVKPTPEQVSTHERLRRLGHSVYVVRSAQEAVDAVTAHAFAVQHLGGAMLSSKGNP